LSAYLEQLTTRLSQGISALPADLRQRHAAYITGRQNPDGGFPGREGGSDLYYTGFALRSLAILDSLTPAVSQSCAGFLRSKLQEPASVIDFFSLLYSSLLVQWSGGDGPLADLDDQWPERVAGVLESFRAPDGGYAKTAGGASGSTYHTFLVCLTYELLGMPLPDPGKISDFIGARRREDGGFVEIRALGRSGTNPTAAAVGVLQILDSPIPAGVTGFLAGLVGEEGGLRANLRAPLADLLSTFTGAWTLEQQGALDRIDRQALSRFVHSLELPSGGFRGGLWDDATDVEYTFYGLGALALVDSHP
jgi:geranylgeranyl transferase type-2 subunit beta